MYKTKKVAQLIIFEKKNYVFAVTQYSNIAFITATTRAVSHL